MKVSFTEQHGNRRLTTLEAIRKCSLDTEEILANLINHLVNKDLIKIDALEEIFYWDFSIEEVKE